MPTPRKPTLIRFHELKPGPESDFFAQLIEKRPATTRDGKRYFIGKFRDAKRTVSTMPLWQDGPWFEECESEWTVGACYKVRGRLIETDRYGLQLEIEQIRTIIERDHEDGFSEHLFVETPREPEEQFQALQELATAEIRDEPLRSLVMKILTRHEAKVKLLPATTSRFYTFPGGWLEHTLGVARSCVWLTDRYLERFPEMKLNRDLTIAGALLHDLGRLLEVDAKLPGLPPEVNREGGLFGQHFLAFAEIQEQAREIPDLNPELVEILEHIVISHLAHPEWGSPRFPKVPEALIVHHADDLDAKLEMFARCLDRDTSTGPFTHRDQGLMREVLKDRKV